MFYGFQGTDVGTTTNTVDPNAMGGPVLYPTELQQQQQQAPMAFYTTDDANHHNYHLRHHDAPQPDVNVERQHVSAPWNHTVPLCLPWFQSASPFPPAAPTNCFGYGVTDEQLALSQASNVGLHCKRKGPHLDEDVLVNAKQFISEEAMALRMTQLKIGSHSTDDRTMPASHLEKSDCFMSEDLSDLDPRQQLQRPERLPSNVVVLAPEIKELQNDPILPKSILEKLQKPTMELMIWKPPAGIIDEVIRDTLSARAEDKRRKPAADVDRAKKEDDVDDDADGKLGSSFMDVV